MHPAPLRFSSVEYCRYAPSSRLRWTVRGIDIDGPRCVTVLMTRTTETPAPSQSSRSATRYSPHIRTALVLTGTGTAGAYHAGVLRALHEAGVKVDLVAGRGIGAVGAAFAAVDGASQLWEPAGLWSATGATRLYHWRPALRAAAWILGVALGALVLPLGVVVLAALVYPLSYLLGVVGLAGGDWLTSGFGRLVEWVFVPAVLPTWLPRLIVVALALLLGGAGLCGRSGLDAGPRAASAAGGAVVGAARGAARCRSHAGLAREWVVDADARCRVDRAARSRGSGTALQRAVVREPSASLVFRELLTTAHDLDGRRRDLVFALLSGAVPAAVFFSGVSARRRATGIWRRWIWLEARGDTGSTRLPRRSACRWRPSRGWSGSPPAAAGAARRTGSATGRTQSGGCSTRWPRLVPSR